MRRIRVADADIHFRALQAMVGRLHGQNGLVAAVLQMLHRPVLRIVGDHLPMLHVGGNFHVVVLQDVHIDKLIVHMKSAS